MLRRRCGAAGGARGGRQPVPAQVPTRRGNHLHAAPGVREDVRDTGAGRAARRRGCRHCGCAGPRHGCDLMRRAGGGAARLAHVRRACCAAEAHEWVKDVPMANRATPSRGWGRAEAVGGFKHWVAPSVYLRPVRAFGRGCMLCARGVRVCSPAERASPRPAPARAASARPADAREGQGSAPRAGRVASKRRMGKLVFYDIKADGFKVQAMAAVNHSPLDEAEFVALHNRRGAPARRPRSRTACHRSPRVARTSALVPLSCLQRHVARSQPMACWGQPAPRLAPSAAARSAIGMHVGPFGRSAPRPPPVCAGARPRRARRHACRARRR